MVRIVVTSTHEELPKQLEKYTKVGHYTISKRREDGRRIPAWQWFCLGQAAVHLLKRIGKLLITKREQAEIILKFAARMKTAKKTEGKICETDLEYGRMCAKRITALNSRQRNKRILQEMTRARNDPWSQL